MNTVTEVARRFHVSADTIRHYTKLKLLAPIRDPKNGYRYYRLQDESTLRFVLSAKKLGFGLKDIQNILSVAQTGETPCPIVRQLIVERVRIVRQEILDAQFLMAEMESAVEHWQHLPDQTPFGSSVCHLIDAWNLKTQEHNGSGASE